MNLTWFYFHCVLAVVILYKDYNGTLEESLDNFEKKIGLYTYVDTSHREEEEVPFYVPPIEEEEVDSTWLLPPMKSDSTNMIPPFFRPPTESFESDSNMART